LGSIGWGRLNTGGGKRRRRWRSGAKPPVDFRIPNEKKNRYEDRR